MSQNPYASPATKAVAPERALAVHPTLWNPAAAARWSLVFTPIIGAFLLARIWTAIEDHTRARSQNNKTNGNVIYLIMVMGASAVLPQSRAMDSTLRFTSIGMLLVWYFMGGNAQVAFVKEHYGERYLRHGWAKPLLIAAGSFILMVAVMVVIVLLFDPAVVGERGAE